MRLSFRITWDRLDALLATVVHLVYRQWCLVCVCRRGLCPEHIIWSGKQVKRSAFRGAFVQRYLANQQM